MWILVMLSLLIPRLDGEIKLDGKLNEPVWVKAYHVKEFRELTPVYNKIPDYSTEAYVFTTSKAIYVGFRCSGPPPIVENKPRDMVAADYVTFYIAPFGSPSTVFAFSADAGGNIEDFTQKNGIIDVSWDANWQAASYVGDSFYTVEMRIPFKSLTYNRWTQWGINFSRNVSKNRAIYYYKLPRKGDLLPQMQYVTVKAPLNITGQLIPQFVWRKDTTLNYFGEKEVKTYKNIAGDFRVSVSGNSFHLTVNPDFADVEADPFYVNISKYPRFLPEKRPFFVYDMDIFEMPFLMGMPVVKLVYTRAIGSTMMGEIPIDWGAKAVLRQKILKTGVLAVKTDSGETFLYFRPLFNLSKSLQVGGLIGNYSHSETRNRLFSFDSKFRWHNFSAVLIGGRSIYKEEDTDRGNFLDMGISWNNKDYDITLVFERIDSLFNVSKIGFVPGSGYRFNISFNKSLYLKKIPYLVTGVSFTRERDLNERPSAEISPQLTMYLKNGNFISSSIWQGERYSFDPFRRKLVHYRNWGAYANFMLNLPPHSVRFYVSRERTYNYLTGEIGLYDYGKISFNMHVSKSISLSNSLSFSQGAGLKRTISTLITGDVNLRKRLSVRIGYENIFSESELYRPFYRYWVFVKYQLGIGGIYVAMSNERDQSGVLNSVSAIKFKYFVSL